MADEKAGGAPQAGASQTTTTNQPQAGVPATTAGTLAEPNGNPGSEPMSLDEAKKLRSEANNLRRRLAEIETAAEAEKAAKLTDVERVAHERDQLKQQIEALRIEQQEYRLAREIARHAPSLNLIDADAAQLMLLAGGEIEFDHDGKPANVGKLLDKLVAEKPYLVASNVRAPQAPSAGGATNPGRSAIPAQPAGARDPKAAYAAHKTRGLGDPSLWKR